MMKFFKKEQKTKTNLKSREIRSKKQLFMTLKYILIVALFLVVSFFAYVLSSSSKIFEGGLTGVSLIKSLYSGETLDGEEDGRINILLLGVGGSGHAGGMLADSIMVASIRPEQKDIAMISIPRDLLVSIPGYADTKINASSSYGYSDYIKKCQRPSSSTCRDEGVVAGAKLAVKTVEKTLDLPIHYYILIDFQGFEDIIDSFGGIEINNEYRLYDPEYPCDDDESKSCGFTLKAGKMKVDGATALKYARCRKGNCGNDFGRAARQQEIIMALKDKATDLKIWANPKKFTDITSKLGSSIKTNFSPTEVRPALELFGSIDRSKIINKVLTSEADGELKSYSNGGYFLIPKSGNFKEIQKMVANIFNLDKVENAKIEVLNGSNVVGLAGNLAKEIELELGLDVVSIENAKSSFPKSVIYDFSGGRLPKTLESIKNEYKTFEVATSNDESIRIDKSAEIVIVIGENYKSE